MINRFTNTKYLNQHDESTKTDNQKRFRMIRSLRWLSLAIILTGCGPSAVKDVSNVTPVPVIHAGDANSLENSSSIINNQPSTGDLVDEVSNGIHTITATNRNGHTIDRSSFGTRVPVLAYHHILTATERSSDKRWRNNDMVITVDQFASEMKFLHDHDYHVITLSQLESFIKGEETVPYHSVVLTFDDGYESNFHYALPILKQYGYRATVFAIVSGIPNIPQPWTSSKLLHFSWSEIKNNTSVFDVESHTYAMHYTRNGRAAMLILPQDQILNDLIKSKNLLHANYFAYPYGRYNAKSIELLKQAGYRLAVITTKGYATKGTPIYEVPRFGIEPGLSIQNFETFVSGMYQAPKPKASLSSSLSLTHLTRIKGLTQ